MNAITPERSPVRQRALGGGLFPWAGYGFVLFFLAALVAFWPEYLSRLPRGGIYRHFHAGLMTLWFALLIAQPLLVRTGRRPLHRMLGKSSFVLAPLAVVSMVLLTHVRLQEVTDASMRALAILPLAMATLFAVAYALAIRYRHQPALHARYMICTGLALVDPVGARLLGYYLPFALPDWIVGLDLGAYHASELAYVFGTSWIFADVSRFTPEQAALSSRMQALWAEFGQKDFGAEWPRVEGAGPIRVFEPKGDRLDQTFFERHQCAFWDGTPFGAVAP